LFGSKIGGYKIAHDKHL